MLTFLNESCPNLSKGDHASAHADENNDNTIPGASLIHSTTRPSPQIPDESYFLPPSALGSALTVQLDPEVLDVATLKAPKSNASQTRRSLSRRGRGRGRGSNASSGQPMVILPPMTWTPELQHQLAVAFRTALHHDEASRPSKDEMAALPSFVADFARELKESVPCEGLRRMGSSLPGITATLQVAGYREPEELMHAVESEARDAAETYLAFQEQGTRRGKVLSTADAFTSFVHSLLEVVLAEADRMAKAARVEIDAPIGDEELARQLQAAAMPPIKLPSSIMANREPFKHGEWRKISYVPRPYVRLQEYFIVEEASRAVIERKLLTRKRGGCEGAHCVSRDGLGMYSLEMATFQTKCTCLARNTECDSSCSCKETDCLNRAVTKRHTVRLGDDVEEINSWGMDCYTRRNIQDAVLESQAYGVYKMPNFSAILGKQATLRGNSMNEMPIRAAATAAGQHAAVAADSPAMEGGIDALVPKDTTANTATPLAPLAIDGSAMVTSPPTDATLTPIPAANEANAPSLKPPSAPGEAKTTLLLSLSAAPTPIDRTEEPKNPMERKQHRAAVEHLVSSWIERILIPAINRQGDCGWDLRVALNDVISWSEASGDTASQMAAKAVLNRLDHVGYNYFRVHPKGVGLICKRPGGLPRLTFVEEYLGEIHQPWRWFELQDAVKKITGDELPDFYNIVLERPRDDPEGYDVLFVDAASKGAFASRMSHSCTPNCQAVVMACGGRLTIALYTLRHVYEGEELTFDYSSVTESEKEFREALCLCGTHMCRGSYLYFTGSRAFMQVLNERHNMLQRQVMLARAGAEPLTDEDRERVHRHGLGESCLGSTSRGDRVPEWLEKWTALVCEYLELEEACLRQELLEKDTLGMYTEATAAAEAKGVVANRLQNVVITLDKVRMFLSQPGQPQTPVLRPLTEEELVHHLWVGAKSIAKRLLRCVAAALSPSPAARRIMGAESAEDLEITLADSRGAMPESFSKIADTAMRPGGSPEECRKLLMELSEVVREVDLDIGGGLTAAADVLLLYASTERWITYERGYRSVTSPVVPINLKDLFLNRETTQLTQLKDSEMDPEERARKEAELAKAAETAAAALARQHRKNPALKKTYRPLYVWGQLSGWFKQTVNDPTASLSAERRGTLSLPDIESCFSGRGRYGAKERGDLIDHLTRRPDAMWKAGTLWSFKNEAKIYGSPMLDSAWAHAVGEGEGALPETLRKLKDAKTPFSMQAPPKKVAKPRTSRGKSRGRAKRMAEEAEMEDIDILLSQLD